MLVSFHFANGVVKTVEIGQAMRPELINGELVVPDIDPPATPCPFCGTTAEPYLLKNPDGRYQVGCPACLARGPASLNFEAALNLWNAIHCETSLLQQE